MYPPFFIQQSFQPGHTLINTIQRVKYHLFPPRRRSDRPSLSRNLLLGLRVPDNWSSLTLRRHRPKVVVPSEHGAIRIKVFREDFVNLFG